MAFLNNLTLRPACVFSDLPHQFLAPLIGELGSVIAATTCDLEELHRTVKLRSASLVVVGASSKSYAIAEQLSHDELAVKVFLVRFNDDFPEPGYKNGFAGIADLRTGSAQFAETLKRAVGIDVHTEKFAMTLAQGLSYEEITAHRYPERPNGDNLPDVLLNRYLKIARASRGLFLMPCAGNSDFKVTAQKGFEKKLPASVHFAPGVLRALQQGHIVEATKGGGIELGWGKEMGHLFTMAVPLIDQKGLRGCLLGNQNGNISELIEFCSHASLLLAKTGRDEEIETIRSTIAITQKLESPFWMLVSASGEISHQEGSLEGLHFQTGDTIRAPRLRDVINKAINGEPGTVCFRGHTITCGKMGGTYARQVLLILGPTSEAQARARSFDLSHEVMLRILKQELSLLSEGGSSQATPELEKMDSNISPYVQIIMCALEKCLDKKLIYKISASTENMTILFEVEESFLEQPLTEEVSTLQTNWIIQLALRVSACRLIRPQWSAGTFGGKLVFTLSPGLLHL